MTVKVSKTGLFIEHIYYDKTEFHWINEEYNEWIIRDDKAYEFLSAENKEDLIYQLKILIEEIESFAG